MDAIHSQRQPNVVIDPPPQATGSFQPNFNCYEALFPVTSPPDASATHYYPAGVPYLPSQAPYIAMAASESQPSPASTGVSNSHPSAPQGYFYYQPPSRLGPSANVPVVTQQPPQNQNQQSQSSATTVVSTTVVPLQQAPQQQPPQSAPPSSLPNSSAAPVSSAGTAQLTGSQVPQPQSIAGSNNRSAQQPQQQPPPVPPPPSSQAQAQAQAQQNQNHSSSGHSSINQQQSASSSGGINNFAFPQPSSSAMRPTIQGQAGPSGSSHVPDKNHQYIPQQQQTVHSGGPVNNQGQASKRKEIYRHQAPFPLYAASWSTRPEPDLKFRLAVGSYIEEYNNKVSLVQLREDTGDFSHLGTFDHPYPATKINWIPDPKGNHPDLISTTGDYLRLWRVGGSHGAKLEVMLNNNRTSDYCAPLTSSDWNEADVSMIGTSSIDTTCTIWQIETGQAIANTARAIEGTVKTQLIAHDKEVFDIAFSKLGREVFASVGADGSLRMFDLRHMEYSTILFEEPHRRPLLRLAWNRQDQNYLATFATASPEVYIIDIRTPSIPVATLRNHSAAISGIAWAPHSHDHICTAGEDSQALIWDIHNLPKPIEDPILAYSAQGEITNVCWSTAFTDWISICYAQSLELLRV